MPLPSDLHIPLPSICRSHKNFRVMHNKNEGEDEAMEEDVNTADGAGGEC